jgi:hypothetical protein
MYMLRFACTYMRGTHIRVPVGMHYHVLQEPKSCLNKNLIQNIHVVSRLKFHVLSNCVLVFDVSLILCTGKWIKLFTETVLAFNLHFQHIGLNIQEKQVHHSKERKFWSRNKIKILHLLCICAWFLPLKDMGICTNRYAYMSAAYTSKP